MRRGHLYRRWSEPKARGHGVGKGVLGRWEIILAQVEGTTVGRMSRVESPVKRWKAVNMGWVGGSGQLPWVIW